jgi:penicillin-binding protein 1C
MLAMDPRIPDDHEYFEFSVTDIKNVKQVKWFLNEKTIATTKGNTYKWKLSRGHFVARAEISLQGIPKPIKTESADFVVN